MKTIVPAVAVSIPADVAGAAAVVATGEVVPAAQLVEALWELNRQQLALEKNIADVTAALIAKGAGRHTGNDPDHALTVVAARAGTTGALYYLFDDKTVKAVDAVEEAWTKVEAKLRDLSGAEFGNLFDRHVIFTPCDGFAKIAPKLLTPAKCRDVLSVCARAAKGSSGSSAYILGLPKA